MKRINQLSFIFVLFLACCPSVVKAQTPEVLSDSLSVDNQLYLIVKTNNVEYVGLILNDDGREVLIDTKKLGKIYIPKSEIRSIEKIKDTRSVVRNEYFGAGPFTTRYIFTTNALPLRKGQNYARINLYGPEAHFALSDNFSLGILTTWAVSPFVISGKYSFVTPNPKVNFSVGTLLGSSGYINDMKSWGALHFGNITYGTPKENVTFSAGYGYIIPGVTSREAQPGVYYTSDTYYNSFTDRQQYPAKGPVISIAGIAKVGSKASFVFDSMIGFISVQTTKVSTTNTGLNFRYNVVDGIDRSTVIILMPGMRFQTRENSAFQISLNTVKYISRSNDSDDENSSFPLPSVSWFYKF
jgi:hypothetical protein